MNNVDKRQLELELVLKHYGIQIESSKFKIICPFHGDVNASLLVDLENASWYCFGCNVGGDAHDFIMEHEKCDDFEAYKMLSKIVKGNAQNKPNVKVNRKTKKQERAAKSEYKKQSKDYYFNLCTVDWNYSKKYGASKEKIYLLKRGFDAKALNMAGCKITYNANYPIIFPMYDRGRFKGYVCRTMDREIEKKRKYLYNKGFSRRNTLVGEYDCKTVMVVEGYMDYLKARMFGVKYVVALLGWKATSEQIQKLKDAGVVNIISALDNDKCGKKGAEYLQQFFNVTRFAYPEHLKDIGEMNEKQFNKYKRKTIEWRKKNGN